MRETASEVFMHESNKQVDHVKALLSNIKRRSSETIETVEILESMIRSIEMLAEEARNAVQNKE